MSSYNSKTKFANIINQSSKDKLKLEKNKDNKKKDNRWLYVGNHPISKTSLSTIDLIESTLNNLK